jgi:hypothetical protein
MMGGMSDMTSAQALEQRVRRLEEKLDLLLKKLGAAGHERPK